MKKRKKSSAIIVFSTIALCLLLTGWEKDSSSTLNSYQSRNEFSSQKNLIERATFYAPSKFHCFRMDKKIVDSFLEKGTGAHKIILRFSLKGLSIDQDSLRVIAYWSKSQKQRSGDNLSIELSIDQRDANLDPNQVYVLGNNYLRIKVLKKFLNSLEYPSGITEYSYLLFTPKISIEDQNQLFFHIQAYDPNGNAIPVKKDAKNKFTDNALNTNPSPPAKPDGSLAQ